MKLRPRLAEHAMIRRHVVDGAEQIVVHHAATGALVTLDERAAALALLADGTRDLDGIALAASRAGVYRHAREIEGLFAALEDHDLLADGIEPGPIAPDSTTQWMTPTEREIPIRVLDYRFRCTGGGACCSQYASIPVTATDARRLRKQPFTTLRGDEDGARLVLPFYGGVRTERLAMTLVDGKCLQLDARGKCTIHDGKPTACRIYPATFADTGDSIRVSCGVECDCVLTSLDAADGEPLVDGAWKTASDLPAGITVRVVPESIPITGELTAPRKEVIRFTDAVDIGEDAVSACIRLALHLEAHGVSAAAKDAPEEALQDSLLAKEIRPAVEQVARTMKDAAEAADAWRSEKDRTRRLRHALLTASETMLARGLDASIAAREVHPKAEIFALRAALFGHLLADGRPMNEALRDFSARLLVARELAMSGVRNLGHPVAAVMAAIRGVG